VRTITIPWLSSGALIVSGSSKGSKPGASALDWVVISARSGDGDALADDADGVGLVRPGLRAPLGFELSQTLLPGQTAHEPGLRVAVLRMGYPLADEIPARQLHTG